MAQIYKGHGIELERILIANSVTIKTGDLVKLIAAGCDIADAVTDLVYGICEGIVTKDGLPAASASQSGYTSSTQTHVATSDNLTVAMVHALVRPINSGDVLSMLMDATVGTTTGSNKPGYYADVLTTDAGKLDESNTHVSNVLQFITVDNGQGTGSNQDPQKLGNYVLVRLRETQAPAGVQG